MIVNRAQLADVFGRSLPTIDTWVRQGCPVVQKGSRGVEWQFDSAAVAKWLHHRALEEAGGEEQQNADEIERRTKRAKMRQAELEVAKEMGLVAPIREFELAQSAWAAVVQQNIMNVPARAVLQLLGCTDESEFKRILRAELTLALQQSAKTAIELTEEDGDAEAA